MEITYVNQKKFTEGLVRQGRREGLQLGLNEPSQRTWATEDKLCPLASFAFGNHWK